MNAVLVTGGTSGIGLATAHIFHAAGYFVYLTGRSLEKLLKVKERFKNCEILLADFSDPNLETVINSWDIKNLDILVNNAGQYKLADLQNTSLSEWKNTFQVNTIAPALLSRWAISKLNASPNPNIIFVSSTLAERPHPRSTAYCCSKSAIHTLTKTLALELAPNKIRVNCVAPGIVETPIHGFGTLDMEKTKSKIEFMNSLQPLGRIGQPEEIARAIYFLTEQKNSWITGSILNVDGGINVL